MLIPQAGEPFEVSRVLCLRASLSSNFLLW